MFVHCSLLGKLDGAKQKELLKARQKAEDREADQLTQYDGWGWGCGKGKGKCSGMGVGRGRGVGVGRGRCVGMDVGRGMGVGVGVGRGMGKGKGVHTRGSHAGWFLSKRSWMGA